MNPRVKRMPTPTDAMPRALVPRRVTFENCSEVAGNEGVSNVTECNRSKSKGADRLLQKINNLLENQTYSDVVLENRDQEFHAHKLILCTWSPVFAAIFQHDMMGKKLIKVDICDCETKAFEIFLHFLYSGTVDAISCGNVVDLYYIADKYQVEELKTECVEYMKNSLSVDTFCDIMVFSIRHEDCSLKNAAIEFFCRNIKEIVKTDQWLKYLTENPKHANLLINKALNS